MTATMSFKDLARALAGVGPEDDVPGSGTREKIEYIDIDSILPDPRNFYSLSGMDELVENIELLGLQQPLRVRDDPTDPDKVILVSGHRRREALARLVADGREDLRQVPCIRERAAGSEAFQELRLIYANSDTRRMTSAEVSKQAERVESLLYQLKEEGYDFPGRMRDHVAEACKVSKSKLSRLKVIRDRLAPALAAHWEKGLINEAVAYALAQIPEEDQNLLFSFVHTAPPLWQQWQVDGWRADIQRIRETESRELCGLDSCAYQLERIQSRLEKSETMCAGYCCIRCGLLPLCRRSCPHADKAKFEKKAEQEAFEAEKEARKARRKKEDEETQKAYLEKQAFRWACVSDAVKRSGLSEPEAAMALGLIDCEADWELDGELIHALLGGRRPELGDPDPILPNLLLTEDLDNLCDVANLLGCSLDYLLGRTDVNRWPPEEE
ncbi:MAG: ParB N-terminal domain-containing protein [Clostridia bacterium]|nr:ParB N-terminal domain-containing protein [Clostridia bacterium]